MTGRRAARKKKGNIVFEIFQALLLVFGDVTAVIDSLAVNWENGGRGPSGWDYDARPSATSNLWDIFWGILTLVCFFVLYFIDRH